MDPLYFLVTTTVFGVLVLRISEAVIRVRRADDSATQAKAASRRAVAEVMSAILFSACSFLSALVSLVYMRIGIVRTIVQIADAGVMVST